MKARSQQQIEEEAVEWVLRQDRGLTAREQDELSRWLAADSRHRQALGECRWGWEELDRIAGIQSSMHAVPDPDLLAPRPRSRRRWIAPMVAMAAAAVVALVWVLPENTPPITFAGSTIAELCERRVLEDGSVVELNRGAVMRVAFSQEQRRVYLDRGEANFTVAKDSGRRFMVMAAGVEVSAVGTVFNIALAPETVNVLVTEGQVQVAPAVRQASEVAASVASPTPAPLLTAGQLAIVDTRAPGTPRVASLTREEVEEHLRWRPRMLEFTEAPLGEIAAEFSRRNPIRLVVADSELADRRLSATFRSDNVEGFVRLMQAEFGMNATWRGESEIVLKRVH